MIKVVNAVGMECPIPVAKTREAIRQLNGPGIVETIVDNETAVQNLEKMAVQMHYGVRTEQLDEDSWRVVISVREQAPEKQAKEKAPEQPDESRDIEEIREDLDDIDALERRSRKKKIVVQITADLIGGRQDEDLGEQMMKSFIHAFLLQPVLPDVMIFYKRGTFLTCEGSSVLDDLRTLEARSVKILTSGTCLGYYRMNGQLQVGRDADIPEITGELMSADLIVRP